MTQHLNYIYQKIEKLNPRHGKKLRQNIAFFDACYYDLADAFFRKYIDILQQQSKTLDYAIECYLQMIADVNRETVEFLRSGKYTSNTFNEVNNRVYAQPQTMEYYMHGLIMSQFLWKHHYQVFDFFINTLPAYTNTTKSYLEVGVGHGFYLSKALEVLNGDTVFTAVDISKTSIDLAKRFIGDSRTTYNLEDVFNFDKQQKYDFITLGEVLEHVEEPVKLLVKLNDLLSENGVLFFTTPTNAPAIDHIYLFNNVGEIRDVIKAAGFQVESERAFLSEDVSPENAEKYKISVLYAAFIKKTTITG